jgi:glycosyltransferase involved in cell wall biosynthesis
MRSAPIADVGIIIPCFEQKHFLPTAIASATAQRARAREVIVVDDGSSQDLSGVVAAFPGVTLIRRQNGGLAAARNTGLEASSAERVIFLDADDFLLPRAVAAGIKCFRSNPHAAFVYGAFEELRGTAATRAFCRVSHHHDLVKCNWIGMIATVMFDRAKLLDEGGFDESLGMVEDWDAYLRLSRRFPFAAHPNVVACYVKHGTNMSGDLAELKKWIDVVRRKEWERGLDAAGQRAWHEGEALCRETLNPVHIPQVSIVERALRKGARLIGLPG